MHHRFLRSPAVGLLLILLIGACAPTRLVKPLEKDQKALSVALGGPLIRLGGTTLPIPFSSIGMAKGLTDQVTGYSYFHLTSALYRTFHLETGITWGLWEPLDWRPGLSLSPALQWMAGPRFDDQRDVWQLNGRIYPTLDLNLYWEYGQRDHRWYLGMGNWLELRQTRAHGEDQPRQWIPTYQVGHTLVWPGIELSAEVRLIAPLRYNEDLTVNYQSLLGAYGATGLYLAATRKF